MVTEGQASILVLASGDSSFFGRLDEIVQPDETAADRNDQGPGINWRVNSVLQPFKNRLIYMTFIIVLIIEIRYLS